MKMSNNSAEQNMQMEFDKTKINCFTIMVTEGICAFFYDLYTTYPGYVEAYGEECQNLLDWSYVTLCALGLSILFCSLNIIATYFKQVQVVKVFQMLVGFNQLFILVAFFGDWIFLNSNCGHLNVLNKVFFIIMMTILGISLAVYLFKCFQSKR